MDTLATKKIDAAPRVGVEEKDDGVRYVCDLCPGYVKPDDDGSGMKCHDCGREFILCSECLPDADDYGPKAVWLCPECR